MAKADGGQVYRYGFSPKLYELMPNGVVREIKPSQLGQLGYASGDVKTKKGEVFSKPNDATVYEYHPETQQYYAIPSPQALQAAGYKMQNVQTWDDNKLADIISADIAIEDQANSEMDFETWYKAFQPADELAAKDLAKEYLAVNEQRLNEDYTINRDQLKQTWQRAKEDYQLTDKSIKGEIGRVTRDKIQALEQIQTNQGRTLTGFWDNVGKGGLSRSGIRNEKEGQINQDFTTQRKGVNQSAADNLQSLAEQRQAAKLRYTRFGQDVQGSRSSLDLTKNRGLEDIKTQRADFLQQQRDELKSQKRTPFESSRLAARRYGGQ